MGFRRPRPAPTNLTNTSSFGEYLDFYRSRAGLSETKLALFARLNQSTVSKITHGTMKNVSVPMLVCICLALGLNENEAVDLLARRERAFSPADDTHRVYLELIRMYSEKNLDYSLSDVDSQLLLQEADDYLVQAGKKKLPNAWEKKK